MAFNFGGSFKTPEMNARKKISSIFFTSTEEITRFLLQRTLPTMNDPYTACPITRSLPTVHVNMMRKKSKVHTIQCFFKIRGWGNFFFFF